MKKYIFIFRLRFMNSLQYRTVVLGGVLKRIYLGIYGDFDVQGTL